MKDGWHNEEHFVLFESKDEATAATTRYSLSDYLPGFFIVGFRGWDDFILCDVHGEYFTVPTVPLTKAELTPYSFPANTLKLKSDARFENRIKWYVTPIAFGGSPTQKENVVWITHEEHVELVRFWNKTYRDIKNKTA
ncbi:MAG: hypothetical protein ABIZ04_09980 [Opitutus sp.]